MCEQFHPAEMLIFFFLVIFRRRNTTIISLDVVQNQTKIKHRNAMERLTCAVQKTNIIRIQLKFLTRAGQKTNIIRIQLKFLTCAVQKKTNIITQR